MDDLSLGTRHRIIDLTHFLRQGLPVYPGDPVLELAEVGSSPPGAFRLTRITLGSHAGTHVDAASHCLASGATVDRLPLTSLVGPAVVIDVPGEEGAVIGVEDLARSEDVFQPGCRVLLRSGWGVHYGTARYYGNHPGLSLDAARWLAQHRVGLLGFDTPSPAVDALAVHETLLGGDRSIAVVESLANLERLPRAFFLVVLPLAVVGLDGAPARAIGLVEESGSIP
ncbi:MAG: cyclase family protein [Pirellulales bacterium]